MALKYIIDDLVEVPGPLRSEYKAADGKFHLSLDGHPDTTRVVEFRSNNIRLANEKKELEAKLAPFDGIDPVAAKEALAKVASGGGEELVKLKLQLAEAESHAASATQKADALVFEQRVSSAFVAHGGRPSAVPYMVNAAPFVLADGELRAKDGAPPTIEEWLKDQAVANHWLFLESKGGGAPGSKPGATLGMRANVRELVNPTPQELGAAAADIKAGKVKVAYTT
jgi:hypothetical protein